jgi:hypothetical protein
VLAERAEGDMGVCKELARDEASKKYILDSALNTKTLILT